METDPRRRHDRNAPASSLERHIGYWLRRVSSHDSGAFARGLNTRHASVAEWVVLRTLHARHGTTAAELADTLGLTRGAVSKILDKLEGKKWITRKRKPRDSRVRLLAVTRQARHILPQLAEIADRNDRQVFGCLDAEESAALRRLLQKSHFNHKETSMSKAIDNLEQAMKRAMANRPTIGGFPHLAETLRRAGVTRNIWFLPACESLYLTNAGPVVSQGQPLASGTIDVPLFNREALIAALRIDQAGESTFPEFLAASWRAGVVRYDVDFAERTVAYYGCNGEVYVEAYPAVDVP